METMEYIRIINGRWTVNGREFPEMTYNEQQTLAEKIKMLQT